MISNVNTTSHWDKVVQSPNYHLPHNPNMNNKPTPLSQPASPHQLLRNLPTPKLVAKALQPRLEHVGTPQLLRNQYNRRLLALVAQPTQRRTRTIQRLNQGLVVYAIGCYDEIHSRGRRYIVCFPIQCFYFDPAIPITATFLPLPRLWKHDIQILSDVLAQQFEDVVLVCGGVLGDFGSEGECDDAGDAGTEFEDVRGGGEQGGCKEEVCGGGEPG
jgi:hypothetical protein